MINVSKLKEYFLSFIYIVFSIICYFDIDSNVENIIFSVIFTGFWSADYTGGIFKRFRDLFIWYFFYAFTIFISFIKFGNISIKIVSLYVVLVSILFFLPYIIGKLLISKSSIYNSFKQSVLIYFSYLFIVVTFEDVLIAHSIWLIVVFISIIYFFGKGFSFLKTLIITVPFFIFNIIMYLFDSNIFIEVDVIYFIIYAIGLFFIWKLKVSFFNQSSIIFVLISILLITFAIIPFTENILNQKELNSYKVFSKVFEKPLIYNNDTIKLSDFKGKVLVLDFWYSACGSCFEKFPQFENLASKYKSNKDILFFAVNKPLKSENSNYPKKIMDSLDYKFQNLYLLNDSIVNGLGIKYYPTILYINKAQTEVISGNIETYFWIFNNSYNIIDELNNK